MTAIVAEVVIRRLTLPDYEHNVSARLGELSIKGGAHPLAGPDFQWQRRDGRYNETKAETEQQPWQWVGHVCVTERRRGPSRGRQAAQYSGTTLRRRLVT